MSHNCLFCRIIRGEIPSTQVYSDDRTLAFRDIHPVAPVHLLVIPKEHVELIASTRPEHEPLLGRLMRVAAQVAREAGVDGTGYRVTVNQGADAGQQVDHLHLHVLGGRRLGGMG